MHSSMFVGRVGGLAIALGIGVTLSIAGYGVAHAAPDDSAATSETAPRPAHRTEKAQRRAATSPATNRITPVAFTRRSNATAGNSRLGQNPDIPAESPLSWTVAAAVRREFSSPAAAAPATSQTAPRVVTNVVLPNGASPLSVAVAPNGAKAYVSTIGYDDYSGTSIGALSVIDTVTNTVSANIDLPTAIPFTVAVTPNGARAYVTGMTTDYYTGDSIGAVTVIDTATNRIAATINMPSDTQATLGMAIRPDGKRAYVSTIRLDPYTGTPTGAVSVIDTATNKIAASIALPSGTAPVAIAVTPNGARAYVTTATYDEYSGASNSGLAIIDTASNRITGTVGLPAGATTQIFSINGLAITPDGKRVYITTADDVSGGAVVVLDTTTNRISGTVALPESSAPLAVKISPDGTRALVTTAYTDPETWDTVSAVSVIDTATNAILSTTPVGIGYSFSLAIAPSGARAYIPSGDALEGYGGGSLAVLDTAWLTTKLSVGSPNSKTGVVTGSVTGSSPSSQSYSYSIADNPSKGTVTITSKGAFTYTPTSAAMHAAARSDATSSDTTDQFSIVVAGNQGGTATVPVTVTVTAKNSVPSGAKFTIGATNGSTGAVTGNVTASDADRDSLRFSAPASTGKGSITMNASTGAFTYTPTAAARQNAGKSGAKSADKSDSFTVTITDGYGGSATVAVKVTIRPA